MRTPHLAAAVLVAAALTLLSAGHAALARSIQAQPQPAQAAAPKR